MTSRLDGHVTKRPVPDTPHHARTGEGNGTHAPRTQTSQETGRASIGSTLVALLQVLAVSARWTGDDKKRSTTRKGAIMIRRSRNIVGLVMTVMLWGGGTAPALATAPVTTPLLVNVVMEPAVCDFPLRVAFTVEAQITRFFDQDGELVRRVVHVQESDAVFTNLDTGATVERDRIATFRQVHDDELNLADQVTFSGIFLIIRTPGEPGVILDAGRHTLDLPAREVVFRAGPKSFVDDGWAVLCPLLS